MLRRILPLLLVALTTGAALAAPSRRAVADRPALVVLISIDQFRADYLTRFADLYLPPTSGRRVGGFRYLQSAGAWYPDCEYQHHRTVTGVGHSILGTGAQPCVSGIVGNDWWDRTAGRSVYCVSDPRSRIVGAPVGSPEQPMSAANQLVTTLGDELELATGGHARTVSISLKERAAILLAGHRADQVVWFASGAGKWISSSYYCKDGHLPAWADTIDAEHLPDQLRQQPWVPSVSAEALQRVWPPSGAAVTFSHPRSGPGYDAFETSPAGNEFVFRTAEAAVQAEGLGKHDVPDLLTINLASNDYVGHRYGPDSAEILDISVQTDRQLSEFLNFLQEHVPGGLARVTFTVSADHGAVTVPELNTAAGVPAGRLVAAGVRTAAERALDEGVGPADWIVSLTNGELYFNPKALAAYPQATLPQLEERVCAAVRSLPGVYLAVGKSAVLAGQVPNTMVGRRLSQGVHPARSGDVIVILDPQWLAGSQPVGTGTSHGNPFTYDAHVPLLMAGCGVRPGVYGSRVAPAQVAPSLAHLLRVARPSAADEPLLPGLQGMAELAPAMK